MAATISHLVSVLILKRSILTEKVARRGFHVMREYSVDPLEATFVREVMDTDVFTVTPEQAAGRDLRGPARRIARAPAAALSRCWTRHRRLSESCPGRPCSQRTGPSRHLRGGGHAVSRGPGLPRRDPAHRWPTAWLQHGLGVLPVVERADADRLVGLVTQFDLLQARQKLLEEERHAERVLTLRRATPKSVSSDPAEPEET